MLDKKINETIETLIKKIKENNLGSIKLSNKINTIEISNSIVDQNFNNSNKNISTVNNQNVNNEQNNNFLSIDSPMVGVIY